MANPFDSVQPGDPLVIQAPAWNALMSMARSTRTGPGSATSPFFEGTVVRVKNESGSDLDRFSVLGLGDPIFTPQDTNEDAFLREVTFRGLVPDLAKHKKRFCVTAEPATDGRIVRAYAAGVCPALVDVQHASHEYATIAAGDKAALRSSRYGFAQVLWREGDQATPYGDSLHTGVQWAIVRLGAHCPSVAIGKASTAITARAGTTYGTGSVRLYRSLAGAEDGPLETVAVLNVGVAIASGKYVSVGWDMDGTAWAAPLEC